jgi:hypothetical protein
MESVLSALLKAGPAYLLAAVVLAIMIWDRRHFREERREREAKLDALAEKLYEVAMASVKKDAEVHNVLESVRKDVEEVRKLSLPRGT